jgi:uncharacterized membrane protein
MAHIIGWRWTWFPGGKMEIVGNIFGTYIPLCCLSLPVLGFFALVAALPVAFLALSKQEAGSKGQEAGSREQGVQNGE